MEAFRTPRKTTLDHCPTNPFLIWLPRQCQKWWVVCTWSPYRCCLALGLSAVLMSLAKLHKRPKDFCFYVDVYGVGGVENIQPWTLPHQFLANQVYLRQSQQSWVLDLHYLAHKLCCLPKEYCWHQNHPANSRKKQISKTQLKNKINKRQGNMVPAKPS